MIEVFHEYFKSTIPLVTFDFYLGHRVSVKFKKVTLLSQELQIKIKFAIDIAYQKRARHKLDLPVSHSREDNC